MLPKSVHRISVSVLLMGLLAACSVQPTPGGGYAMSSATLGQMLQMPGSNYAAAGPVPVDPGVFRPPSSRAAYAPVSAKMNFKGMMEGGRGSADLTALGGNRYHIGLEVEGAEGAGVVVGTAYRRANTLTMQQGYSPGPGGSNSGRPQPCDIVMKLVSGGQGLSVDEVSCMNFHGGTVSFNGSLERVK